VVVNERTGTIVMGEHVRLSSMAVSHGNLTIKINTDYNVSQPEAPLVVGRGVGRRPGRGGGRRPGRGGGGGETVVTPDVTTDVDEEPGRVIQVDRSITLGDLVRALNSVGVTPRDLVAILTAAKAAGALQADLQMI